MVPFVFFYILRNEIWDISLILLFGTLGSLRVNPFSLRVNHGYMYNTVVVITFHSVHKIIWHDNSNAMSLAVLLYGTTCICF